MDNQEMTGLSDHQDIYNYICPYLSNCEARPLCPYNYHRDHPYEWRLLRSDAMTLLSILGQEDGKVLEKQFCDPDVTMGELDKLKINFNTMMATLEGNTSIPIQRISTPPVNLCGKQGKTSDWIWYWQSDDPSVNWSEMKFYEEDLETEGNEGLGMGALLERLYDMQEQLLKGQKEPFIDVEEDMIVKQRLVLIGKEDQYRVMLNFYKMTITMNDGDEYEVRRRPDTFNIFVDWCYLDRSPGSKISWVTFGDLNPLGDTKYPITTQELESYHEDIKRNKCSVSFTQEGYSLDMRLQEMKIVEKRTGKITTVPVRRDVFQGSQLIPLNFYPSNWDPMPKSRIYVTFTVPEETDEFKTIKKLIPSTHRLTRLRRIQNPATYKSYMETKANLEKDFPSQAHLLDGGKIVKEETLFHGTRDINIKLICETNFDPKLAGTVNGKAYGAGTYFGKDVETSLPYCKSKDLVKLFVCKVLVGLKALGHAQQNPPADKRITLVNVLHPTSIFVNRLPHSFRPEYIAELRLSR